MKQQSVSGLVCLLAALVCLALAAGMTRDWQLMAGIAVMLLLWVVMGKEARFWGASMLLALYIVLAAVSVVRHAPVLLLVTGCSLALASWELMSGSREPSIETQDRRVEQRRLQSLAAVGAATLLLTVPTSLLRVRLPFGAVAVAVLVAMGCMLYAVHRARSAGP